MDRGLDRDLRASVANYILGYSWVVDPKLDSVLESGKHSEMSSVLQYLSALQNEEGLLDPRRLCVTCRGKWAIGHSPDTFSLDAFCLATIQVLRSTNTVAV